MPALIGPDGRHFQLKDGVVVGRIGTDGAQPDVDLGMLERAMTISRRHARIRRRGQDWYLRVEDQVTNATRVAGRKLGAGQESALDDGDEVELGGVPLVFLADWDSEATLVGLQQANAMLVVEGTQFPLNTTEGRRLRIGRRSPDGKYTPDIDLRDLPASGSVSHLHGHLIRRNGRDWFLHVVKTTNGTNVAGKEVAPGEIVPLSNGDTLQLGRFRATFRQIIAADIDHNERLALSVIPEETIIETGGQQQGRINLVNVSGQVHQILLELTGIPNEWFMLGLDGKTGHALNLQLLNAVEPNQPLAGSAAQAVVTYTPPRVPESRAGVYPISISATTGGEVQIRRVVTSRLRVLPFEGLEVSAGPEEIRKSRGEYTLEIHNTGNSEVMVDLRIDTHTKKVKAEPSQLQFRLGNGHTRQVPFVIKARRNWLGLDQTYGVDITVKAGGQQRLAAVRQVVKPILPRWIQWIVGKAFSMFSPIALPVATLALLIGVGYFLLRPPDIKEFRAERGTIVAGGDTQLMWTLDRAAGVSIEPPVADQLSVSEGQLKVMPTAKTEYTLTARNLFGISHSAKTTVDVLQITAFKATPDRLNKEGEEVTLHWETAGATKVKIDPEVEVKDPKSGDAKVTPSAATTYTLTATGTNSVTTTAQVTVAIGAPAIDSFEVVPGPGGNRFFQGDPVQLKWAAKGYSKLVITSSGGDVAPGQPQLDVTGGPPATVNPATPGEVVYTLTASNAAGSTQATRNVTVSAVSIVQFEAEPTKVAPGQPVKLRWRIERPNEATKLVIEGGPGLGPVEGIGERSVSPTVDTTYTLRMTAADGSTQERQVQVSVEVLPTINTFTSPRPTIAFGEEARLTWSVSNATQVEIRTADGTTLLRSDRPEGTMVDFPPQPTTYILEARSASGRSVTKDFSVDVKPPGQPTPPPADPAAPSTSPSVAPAASPAPKP